MRDRANAAAEVTPEELAAAKSYLAAREIVQSEGAMRQVIRRLVREVGTSPLDEDNGPLDLLNPGDPRANGAESAYDPRIEQVTAADVREVIEKYLRPEAMTVVVVAPRSAVKASLAQLGDVRIISPEGDEPPR
jgi:predicted Zn-dependent peptidase